MQDVWTLEVTLKSPATQSMFDKNECFSLWERRILWRKMFLCLLGLLFYQSTIQFKYMHYCFLFTFFIFVNRAFLLTRKKKKKITVRFYVFRFVWQNKETFIRSIPMNAVCHVCACLMRQNVEFLVGQSYARNEWTRSRAHQNKWQMRSLFLQPTRWERVSFPPHYFFRLTPSCNVPEHVRVIFLLQPHICRSS